MASQAVMGAGAGFSAAGALFEGQAQSNALNRAAQIERQNAQLDIEAGQANADISAIHSNRAISQITASYGGSGVAADSGSALAVLAASEANAELDRQNIMHGAKVRAVNYENQANMDQIGAESALKGSYLNAFASLVGGGAKAFGQSQGVSPGTYQPVRAGGQDASEPYVGGGGADYITPGIGE